MALWIQGKKYTLLVRKMYFVEGLSPVGIFPFQVFLHFFTAVANLLNSTLYFLFGNTHFLGEITDFVFLFTGYSRAVLATPHLIVIRHTICFWLENIGLLFLLSSSAC